MSAVKNFCLTFFIAFLLGQGARASAWRGHPEESLSTQLVEFLRQDQRVQDGLLKLLIEQRCTTYLSVGFLDDRDQHVKHKDCQWMGRNLLRLLDSRLFTFRHPLSHKDVRLPAVFVTDLVQLAKDPRARYFVKTFLQKSDMAANGLGDLDPYGLALEVTGNQDEALRFMAVLFQDTSPAKTHVEWLRQNTGADESEFVNELGQAMDRWAAIESGHFRLQSRFLRFPSELAAFNQGQHNRAYHFYVPAYLSRLLLAKSPIRSPRTAFLGPFLMNYLYECLHEGNPIVRGIEEPQHFDADSAGDVAMGYEGSGWATGVRARLGITGAQFREQLMDSPKNTLVRLGIGLNSLDLGMTAAPPVSPTDADDADDSSDN